MSTQIEIPDVPPLSHQDITIMRCTICGAIVPGNWRVSRKTKRAGIDHVLDRHRADLIAGRLRPPLFMNCAIQDPFWFDERIAEDAA
ncbi:hypothetical protein NE236_41860 [Actinoallomurus purpureus]|uniref:hypothetical protein n=1 Tax=Actinoallomurus purpureus TaxID=478114 RepID=UPI00209349F8|nr:hypothetical protein [Actinoallomurus purpureus]MCO6011517.1 hypothetical protein [Actinoallomurus purpureus]